MRVVHMFDLGLDLNEHVLSFGFVSDICVFESITVHIKPFQIPLLYHTKVFGKLLK